MQDLPLLRPTSTLLLLAPSQSFILNPCALYALISPLHPLTLPSTTPPSLAISAGFPIGFLVALTLAWLPTLAPSQWACHSQPLLSWLHSSEGCSGPCQLLACPVPLSSVDSYTLVPLSKPRLLHGHRLLCLPSRVLPSLFFIFSIIDLMKGKIRDRASMVA